MVNVNGTEQSSESNELPNACCNVRDPLNDHQNDDANDNRSVENGVVVIEKLKESPKDIQESQTVELVSENENGNNSNSNNEVSMKDNEKNHSNIKHEVNNQDNEEKTINNHHKDCKVDEVSESTTTSSLTSTNGKETNSNPIVPCIKDEYESGYNDNQEKQTQSNNNKITTTTNHIPNSPNATRKKRKLMDDFKEEDSVASPTPLRESSLDDDETSSKYCKLSDTTQPRDAASIIQLHPVATEKKAYNNSSNSVKSVDSPTNTNTMTAANQGIEGNSKLKNGSKDKQERSPSGGRQTPRKDKTGTNHTPNSRKKSINPQRRSSPRDMERIAKIIRPGDAIGHSEESHLSTSHPSAERKRRIFKKDVEYRSENNENKVEFKTRKNGSEVVFKRQLFDECCTAYLTQQTNTRKRKMKIRDTRYYDDEDNDSENEFDGHIHEDFPFTPLDTDTNTPDDAHSLSIKEDSSNCVEEKSSRHRIINEASNFKRAGNLTKKRTRKKKTESNDDVHEIDNGVPLSDNECSIALESVVVDYSTDEDEEDDLPVLFSDGVRIDSKALIQKLLDGMSIHGAYMNGLRKVLPETSETTILHCINYIRSKRKKEKAIWERGEIDRLQQAFELFGSDMIKLELAVGTRCRIQIKNRLRILKASKNGRKMIGTDNTETVVANHNVLDHVEPKNDDQQDSKVFLNAVSKFGGNLVRLQKVLPHLSENEMEIRLMKLAKERIGQKWEKDEITRLKNGLSSHEKNYNALFRCVGTRTMTQISSFLSNIASEKSHHKDVSADMVKEWMSKENNNYRKGAWTKDEIERLDNAILKYGDNNSIKLSNAVRTRSGNQICDLWRNIRAGRSFKVIFDNMTDRVTLKSSKFGNVKVESDFWKTLGPSSQSNLDEMSDTTERASIQEPVINNNYRKGPWTRDEIELLDKAILKYGKNNTIKLSDAVRTRSGNQICDLWGNVRRGKSLKVIVDSMTDRVTLRSTYFGKVKVESDFWTTLGPSSQSRLNEMSDTTERASIQEPVIRAPEGTNPRFTTRRHKALEASARISINAYVENASTRKLPNDSLGELYAATAYGGDSLGQLESMNPSGTDRECTIKLNQSSQLRLPSVSKKMEKDTIRVDKDGESSDCAERESDKDTKVVGGTFDSSLKNRIVVNASEPKSPGNREYYDCIFQYADAFKTSLKPEKDEIIRLFLERFRFVTRAGIVLTESLARIKVHSSLLQKVTASSMQRKEARENNNSQEPEPKLRRRRDSSMIGGGDDEKSEGISDNGELQLDDKSSNRRRRNSQNQSHKPLPKSKREIEFCQFISNDKGSDETEPKPKKSKVVSEGVSQEAKKSIIDRSDNVDEIELSDDKKNYDVEMTEYVEELAFHYFAERHSKFQKLPLPKSLPLTGLPSDRWQYDEKSRVLLVDFRGRAVIPISEKCFLANMMQRDDITVISEGLMENLNSEMWSLDGVELCFAGKPYHKFRRFTRSNDANGHVIFIEQDKFICMKVSDFVRYLSIVQAPDDSLALDPFEYVDADGCTHVEVNVLDVVFYMIDVDMPKYMPVHDNDYKSSFKIPEMLPGGAWCMMSMLPESARPFMGPNLYLTPGGGYTQVHQDGHGTVDSGHSNLCGFNEVVMLRRLPESHKLQACRKIPTLSGARTEENAFNVLYKLPHDDGRNECALWPTTETIQEWERMNYYPSVFILKPGQHVHINKGRLHCFRKLTCNPLPENDCHYSLRRSIIETYNLKQSPLCLSVAFDWMFWGFDKDGINREVASTIECAALCRQYNCKSLAVPETVLLNAAIRLSSRYAANRKSSPMLGFKASTTQQPLTSPAESSIIAGILPSLRYIVERDIEASNSDNVDKSDELYSGVKLKVAKKPDTFHDPLTYPTDPYGSDYFCMMCNQELSNCYFHCNGCEIILNRDFNICSQCYGEGRYLARVQIHPTSKKWYTDVNHMGDTVTNSMSRSCYCKAGRCRNCPDAFCKLCACKCHKVFTNQFRFIDQVGVENVLKSCEDIAKGDEVTFHRETKARLAKKPL